eukprot:scaffold45614_cov23-Prasinocladus_malaysianus.AAC.1
MALLDRRDARPNNNFQSTLVKLGDDIGEYASRQLTGEGKGPKGSSSSPAPYCAGQVETQCGQGEKNKKKTSQAYE